MDQLPLRLPHRFNLNTVVEIVKIHLRARIELRAEQAHMEREEMVRWAREHINRCAGQHVRYQREGKHGKR